MELVVLDEHVASDATLAYVSTYLVHNSESALYGPTVFTAPGAR